MKRAAARKGKTKAQTKPTSVAEYLAATPQPARGTLNRIRAMIRSAVPSGSEEVISYGIPAFRHTKAIIWYAAFSDHCSLFPTSSVIAKFKDELKNYRVSKGTIQFPVEKPLPAKLVKKLVKARLNELEIKKRP